MYRFIFDILTDPLGLPVKDIWEYAILAAIGIAAFAVGWEVSPGGRFGAMIHWCVRLLAFLVLWAIAYLILAVAQWVIAHMVLVCLVVTAVIAVALGASVAKVYFL